MNKRNKQGIDYWKHRAIEADKKLGNQEQLIDSQQRQIDELTTNLGELRRQHDQEHHGRVEHFLTEDEIRSANIGGE